MKQIPVVQGVLEGGDGGRREEGSSVGECSKFGGRGGGVHSGKALVQEGRSAGGDYGSWVVSNKTQLSKPVDDVHVPKRRSLLLKWTWTAVASNVPMQPVSHNFPADDSGKKSSVQCHDDVNAVSRNGKLRYVKLCFVCRVQS